MTRSSDDILLAKPKVKDFISDHTAIICHLQSFKHKPEPTEFCYRKLKYIDLSSFKKDIIEYDIVQNPTEDLGGLVMIPCQIFWINMHLKTCKLRMRESQP